MNQISLGLDLRNLRRAAGITLREMARRMKVTAPYISDLELGRRHWPDARIEQFKAECKKERSNK